MRYHHFIERTSDLRNGEYDLFVLVPVMRSTSTRQGWWSKFVGEAGMHSFLSVPMNDTKLKFSVTKMEVGQYNYPVLRVVSSTHGTFHVPFVPTKLGERQVIETYQSIQQTCRRYMREQRQNAKVAANGGNKATASAAPAKPGGPMGNNVAVHPASIERISEAQTDRAIDQAKAQSSSANMTRSTSAQARSETSASDKKPAEKPPAAPTAYKKADKRKKAPTKKAATKGAGSTIAEYAKLAGFGAGIGAISVAAIVALAPVAHAQQGEGTQNGDPVELVVEQQDSLELPLPQVTSKPEKASKAPACGSGANGLIDQSQRLSALTDNVGE